jgi:hypothetical protein
VYAPKAELELPPVLVVSALKPNAVLRPPCAVLMSAEVPPAVLARLSLCVGFGGPARLSPLSNRSKRLAIPRAALIEGLLTPCLPHFDLIIAVAPFLFSVRTAAGGFNNPDRREVDKGAGAGSDRLVDTSATTA